MKLQKLNEYLNESTFDSPRSRNEFFIKGTPYVSKNEDTKIVNEFTIDVPNYITQLYIDTEDIAKCQYEIAFSNSDTIKVIYEIDEDFKQIKVDRVKVNFTDLAGARQNDIFMKLEDGLNSALKNNSSLLQVILNYYVQLRTKK